MNRLAEMNEKELIAEIRRLEDGKVGVGFKTEYLHQCIGIVRKEIKSRKPRE